MVNVQGRENNQNTTIALA